MTVSGDLWIQGGIFLVAVFGLVVSSNRVSEGKRARIYERIDEVKRNFEEKSVSKEVCTLTTDHMQKDLSEIKTDVKILLRLTGNKKRE